jgi:hypothetical protein
LRYPAPAYQRHTLHSRFAFLLCLIAVVLLFSVGAALALDKPLQGEAVLLDTYHKNIHRLEKNSFGLPLILDSFEQADRVHVDVYGIFEHPFSSVGDVLKVPANWCDIVSLNPNVKACTYRTLPSAGLLTFYIGRKVYQTPEDARQVLYQYRIVDQQPGYLDINLSAAEGPFGTKDHQMRFEALPLVMLIAIVLLCASRARSILRLSDGAS